MRDSPMRDRRPSPRRGSWTSPWSGRAGRARRTPREGRRRPPLRVGLAELLETTSRAFSSEGGDEGDGTDEASAVSASSTENGHAARTAAAGRRDRERAGVATGERASASALMPLRRVCARCRLEDPARQRLRTTTLTSSQQSQLSYWANTKSRVFGRQPSSFLSALTIACSAWCRSRRFGACSPVIRVHRSLDSLDTSRDTREDDIHVNLGRLRDFGRISCTETNVRWYVRGCLRFFRAPEAGAVRVPRRSGRRLSPPRRSRSERILTDPPFPRHRTRRTRLSATTVSTRRTGSSPISPKASCTARFRCSCSTRTIGFCCNRERLRKSRSLLCGRTRAVRTAAWVRAERGGHGRGHQERRRPGCGRAAIRKLEHGAAVAPASVPLRKFKYLTRPHYCAADAFATNQEINGGPWGEHEMDYIPFIKRRRAS